MRSRPRVIYWDNLPAPYAVERYNTLADRGNLDFAVWFLRRTDPDRSWAVRESEWRFRGTYIEDPSAGLGSVHRFVRRCDEARPDLVLSLYGERPFVIGHAVLKALDIRTAVLVLPTFDAWIRRAWWKELAKGIIFRSADAAKVPGPDGLAYARRYGFPAERVSFVTQSVDIDRYSLAISADERRYVRQRLGVDGCVFLYVGRFWTGKGLFLLIDAFRRVRAADPGVSLLMIGDGPDEGALRRAVGDLEGVTFQPFVQARELPAYYAAADVFVFPTLGDPHGQVIEEAHAAGLPIITTDAAGDVRRRVEEGVSGFIVPAGEAAPLAARMLELAADPGLRHVMGARGAERVKGWDHQVWAADFEQFVSAALTVRRRSTMAARATDLAGRVLVTAAEVVARAHVFRNKAAGGALTAVQTTVVARLNRLGMRLASLPWRLGAPREPMRRFGTRHGGWLLPVGKLTPPGVCYCVGVGEDTSLEDELLRRTDCLVWSFDPTPRSTAHVAKQPFDPARFRFVPAGVWDRAETRRFFGHQNPAFETHSAVNLWKTDSYFEAPCTTVAALMREFGHDRLVLLKIAVEGAEWQVLQNILDDAVDARILCVVFCQPASFWRVTAMVRRLRRGGYRYLCHDEWKFTFVRETGL
jgi:FkbM family methyltransferase